MALDSDEIKTYLPQYLSSSDKSALLSELKLFPKNKNYYTNTLQDTDFIYQGDGINKLIHMNLPDTKTQENKGIVLSNTCDLDCENDRIMPIRLLHSPIMNLQKYNDMLINVFVKTELRTSQYVQNHIDNIKRQFITHILYLPKGSGLKNDSIVFLDRTTSLPPELINRDKLIKSRLFTLSNFGFYLFLLKVSIHFTRAKEDVNRN